MLEINDKRNALLYVDVGGGYFTVGDVKVNGTALSTADAIGHMSNQGGMDEYVFLFRIGDVVTLPENTRLYVPGGYNIAFRPGTEGSGDYTSDITDFPIKTEVLFLSNLE